MLELDSEWRLKFILAQCTNSELSRRIVFTGFCLLHVAKYYISAMQLVLFGFKSFFSYF